MGISIDTVTHGISKAGAENFKQKIHQEAIEDTKSQLSKIDGIVSAIDSAWQGTAAENFKTNLRTNVNKVQATLDTLDAALTTEFDNILNAVLTADEEMVTIEE